MRTRVGTLILLLATLAVVLVGCSGGDGDPRGVNDGDGVIGTSGTVQVFLTDAPAAYLTEVWVTILRVELVPEGEGPIVALDSGELPGQFELLSLSGQPLELGVIEAPVGSYLQVRLILAADGHFIVDAGGEQHELRIPSGDQTGVKVNFPHDALEVDEGQTTLLLDFLAAPSVHQAGQSGQWIMRPVVIGSIHGSADFDFGSLSGRVQLEDGTIPQPLDSNPPAIFAVGDRATSIAEIDPETGEFELPSVLAGEYELRLGWLAADGDMAEGEVLIVIDDGTPQQINVTLEAGSTLSREITVRPGAPEDLPGGPPAEVPQPPYPPNI